MVRCTNAGWAGPRSSRPIWPGRWAISPRPATPLQDRGPSRLLADALAGRSVALLNTGQLAEGTEEGRRALAMARELGDPAAEVLALGLLGIAALYSGDNDGAVELIRRQQQITGGVPGAIARAGSAVYDRCADRSRGPGRRRERLRGGAGPVPGRR